MCSSPRLTDWGQTYQQNMFSSPRFTGWEVKPTIGTCISLHASRVERSNLPSGHAFFSTLYGLRAQTYHQDMRSSPRFTGWELKPTIRTCVLLHALRFERSNLPSGHTFFSTLYGWRGQTYHEDKRFSHALRVERSNLPSGLAFFSTLYGLRSNPPSEHAFLSTLYGLRGQTYHQDKRSSPRFMGGEVIPTMRTSVLLHALRVERSNLPSGLAFFSTLYGFRSNLPWGQAFFSTLYGLRGQTYHQDMCSSPRFTGWEVKPTIRTCVPLHALRVERSNLPSGHAFLSTLYGLRSNLPSGHAFLSTLYGLRSNLPSGHALLSTLSGLRSNLPSGHAFLSTLYGLRGQTYHQDMRSSPRFTGWELKPTIRTCVLLHALRVERSNLPSGQAFFSTLYGLRGQTYHQVLRSSPRFTGWEVKPTIRT